MSFLRSVKKSVGKSVGKSAGNLSQSVNKKLADRNTKKLFDICFKEGDLTPKDIKNVRDLAARKDVDINYAHETGRTALYIACERGYAEVVDILCQKGTIDINIRDILYKRSGLHWACENGFVKIVEYLCKLRRLEVNIKDKDGKTPLQIAYENHQDEIIQILCNFSGRELLDVNIDIPDSPSTVAYSQEPRRNILHLACLEGRSQVVDAICGTNGVDVNMIDKDGQTLLHFACKESFPEVVKVLCGLPQLDANPKNNDGCTPLQLAYNDAYDDKEKRPKASSPTNKNDKGVRGWLQKGQSALNRSRIDIDTSEEKTPTSQVGGVNDQSKVVNILCGLEKLDINVQDESGRTVLHWASHKGYHDVVNNLCELPHIEVNVRDKNGLTPVQLACGRGHVKVMEILCGIEEIDINVQHKDGQTVLHRALIERHDEIAKIICGVHKLQVNAIDKNNNCAWELALGQSSNTRTLEIVKMVLSHHSFDVIVPGDKSSVLKTVYDIILDIGATQNQIQNLVEYVGVENFTYVKQLFILPEDLDNIILFHGGAFGALYKAEIDISRENQNQKPVIIPVVCKISKTTAGTNEWFELQVLQNLPRHQNVVALVAMCTGFRPPEEKDSDLTYSAMITNYKSRGSLLGLLKEKKDREPFSLNKLCLYGIDIAKGISHMHKHFYKHCDIASRNFLVGEGRGRTELIVTDFGLSRPLNVEHEFGSMIPYLWSAPETLQTWKTTIQSDIWMVGITFAEISSYPFRLPHFPKFIGSLHKKKIAGLLQFFKDGKHVLKEVPSKIVPVEWIEVINSCCSMSPDQRPSLKDLVVRLEKLSNLPGTFLGDKNGSEDSEDSEQGDFVEDTNYEELPSGYTEDGSLPDGYSQDVSDDETEENKDGSLEDDGYTSEQDVYISKSHDELPTEEKGVDDEDNIEVLKYKVGSLTANLKEALKKIEMLEDQLKQQS